ESGEPSRGCGGPGRHGPARARARPAVTVCHGRRIRMQRPMSAEVIQLMERYVDGDAGAFRALYASLAPKLLGYLAKMTRDRAVPDDLLQHTFLKVHRARDAWVRGTDPTPWIYALAHRTFLDEARRVSRAVVSVAKGEELPDLKAEMNGTAEGAADPPPDPELTRAALAALESLPPQQREAVVLTKL